MNVSIPGSDAPAQQPAQQQAYQPPAQSTPGVMDYALKDACQRELSQGVYPKFSIKAVEDKIATREKGRPMFRDEEWVNITLRGDRNSVTNRPVTDRDRSERWPALYQAFKMGQTRANFGTPLEEWPLCSRSMAETMKHYNVYTVEDLAGLDDNGIQQIGMGAREYMEKAKAYIKSAEDSAEPSKMVDQINQMQAQIDALLKSNDELGAMADLGQSSTDAIEDMRVETNAMKIRLNELEVRNASLENSSAELQMKYDAEKQAHSGTKGQLTKVKKELEAIKAAG